MVFLDVNPAHANDRAYFKAIDDEMKAGGLEALMHVLSTFDLSTVDIYTVPKTQALLEQKEESAPPHVRWWLECLQEGAIKYDSGEVGHRLDIDTVVPWGDEIEKRYLWSSYRLFMKNHNVRSKLWPSDQLHKWLKPLLPGLQVMRRGTSERTRMIVLPSLDVCRKAYARLVGQTVSWD